MKRTISDFSRVLGGFSSYLIFTHNRPDGDCLGSGAALKYALEKLGKRADVICPCAVPKKYSGFDFYGEILSDTSGAYEAHVAVDCSTENMTAQLARRFLNCKNTFNIDHHVSNTRYAKFNLVEERASCTELMAEVINALGVETDKKIATPLMLGVVTDTGCFAYKNVTPSTFYAAAALLEAGADLNDIVFKMFKSSSVERARLQAIAESSLKLYHEGKMAVISLRLPDFNRTGATPDMTEGFIDFALGIEGVEVALSVMETEDKRFKISFRSRGKVNVNDIASTFGGGGHVLASGCMLFGFYEDVIDKLVFTVGNYL